MLGPRIRHAAGENQKNQKKPDCSTLTLDALHGATARASGWSLPCAARTLAQATQLWAGNRGLGKRSPLRSDTTGHKSRYNHWELAEAEQKADVALGRHPLALTERTVRRVNAEQDAVLGGASRRPKRSKPRMSLGQIDWQRRCFVLAGVCSVPGYQKGPLLP